MKLANVGGVPAIVVGDTTHVLEALGPGERSFIDLIRTWDRVPSLLADSPTRPTAELVFGPPVPMPGKIIGAPVNYVDHQAEMKVEHTISGLGFFMKSPSSVTGADGGVTLPFPGRRTDQEAELGVVIGSRARHVAHHDALDHVFGYTCLVDVTVRGPEERSTRKSFDGFTPIGPWVVPIDQIPDPERLRIRGRVNGVTRQDASTAEMVYGVAALIEFISSVVPLDPGDIIATGTPAGVGPIGDGDVIEVEIEHVGTLRVPVALGHVEPHPLWLTRETGAEG